MRTNAWMQVRSWMLAVVLVLAVPVGTAVAQDTRYYAQDEDPEGVVLPGEEGAAQNGGNDNETPARDESSSPRSANDDDNRDRGSDNRPASRAQSTGDNLPRTGPLAVPTVLLGMTLLLSGVVLRRRTSRRRRQW